MSMGIGRKAQIAADHQQKRFSRDLSQPPPDQAEIEPDLNQFDVVETEIEFDFWDHRHTRFHVSVQNSSLSICW
jgi:hypothetical protein